MKVYGGVDVQIHVFLTLALVGGEFHALTVLAAEKKPLVPIRLGGLQSQSGRYGVVKVLDPTGTRTLTRRLPSP
jgi:hypothetical protein